MVIAQGNVLDRDEFGFGVSLSYASVSETDGFISSLSAATGTFEGGIMYASYHDGSESVVIPYIEFYSKTPGERGTSILGLGGTLYLREGLTMVGFELLAAYDHPVEKPVSVQPGAGLSINIPVAGELADDARIEPVLAAGISLYGKTESVIPAMNVSIGYNAKQDAFAFTLGLALGFVHQER